jgi:hypothetical protein
MRFRLLVVARLIGSWAAPLALLGGVGLLTGSWQALWLAKSFFLLSIPPVALTSLVCFVLAHSVASQPFPWTVGAVFISLLAGLVIVGNAAGGLFALYRFRQPCYSCYPSVNGQSRLATPEVWIGS